MLDGLWTHVPRELGEPVGRDIYEGRGAHLREIRGSVAEAPECLSVKRFESSPVRIGLDRIFVIVWKVRKEVEAGQGFDFINTLYEGGEIGALGKPIRLVSIPEANRGCAYDGSRRIGLHFQQDLPVVVRDRDTGGFDRTAGRIQIVDCLISSNGLVNRAGDDIDGFRWTRTAQQAPDFAFERRPDARIELILQLRSLVRHKIGLFQCSLVALPVGIGDLVSPGVVAISIVHSVTVVNNIYLIVIADIACGIIRPIPGMARITLRVRIGEGIGHPQGREVGRAVVERVVPVCVRSRSAAGPVHRHDLVAATVCRKLGKTHRHRCALRRRESVHHVADDRVIIPGFRVVRNNKGLVVVLGRRCALIGTRGESVGCGVENMRR